MALSSDRSSLLFLSRSVAIQVPGHQKRLCRRNKVGVRKKNLRVASAGKDSPLGGKCGNPRTCKGIFSRISCCLSQLEEEHTPTGTQGALQRIIPDLAPQYQVVPPFIIFFLFSPPTSKVFFCCVFRVLRFKSVKSRFTLLGGKKAMCRGGGSRAQGLVRASVVPTTPRSLERVRREMSHLRPWPCATSPPPTIWSP